MKLQIKNGRYFTMIGKERCNCDCHTDGSMHFMPCCYNGFVDKVIWVDSFKLK